MKKKIYHVLLSATVWFFASCSTEPDNVRFDPPEVPETITPLSGGAGDPARILGEGFGTDPNAVSVLVRSASAADQSPSVEAQIVSVSDTEIRFVIPPGDLSGDFAEGEELVIEASVGDRHMMSSRFRFLISPKIVTMQAAENAYTRSAVLNGYRFSSSAEENIVRFGDQTARVISAQRERLVVEIPFVASTTCQVTVQVGEYTSGPVAYVDDRAQSLHNKDSVTVTSFAWDSETLADGVVWKHGYMELSGGWRNINVVEADPATTNLKLSYSGSATGGMKKTSTVCEEAGALAGINGGYFTYSSLTVSSYSGPYDALRIDGVDIVEGAVHRVGATYLSGLMTITDNRLQIHQLPNSERNYWASYLYPANEFPTILAAGPVLAIGGERIAFPSSEASDEHFSLTHNRTAIGVKADGTFLLVTVDGRRATEDPQMVGMSTAMLGHMMRFIGADGALNLDGGGSTTMYIKDRGVVNYPTDGAGERVGGTFVYVVPK